VHESFLVIGFPIFFAVCLYFMTLFLFADIIVVIQRTGFLAAFQASARLVRPFFWKVFTYLMIVVGLSLVPEMIYQLGSTLYPPLAGALQKVVEVVLMPYLMIAQVVLFYEIKSHIQRNIGSLEEQIRSFDADE